VNLLGDRPLGFIAREVVRPANWVALSRMPRRYSHPLDGARRYFTTGGEYPHRFEIRTPQGIVAPTLYSQHDMITVNEVFCREDYRVGDEAQVVVDVGSNIGISALYFLTRSPNTRVWLYEPVPQNVERLRRNLEDYEGRWRIERDAVADRRGEERFAVEPSGRYGALDGPHAESIQVRVRHIDDLLAEVIEAELRIDVLKIDTEGSEASILRAVSPGLLERVGLIYVEDTDRAVAELPGFRARRRASVLRLVNRRPPGRRRSGRRAGPR
jgi:FkbM family methyltransferase